MDNHWFEAAAHHMGDAYLNYSFTKGSEQEVAFLIKELDLKPGMKLLDVGCGPGRHSHLFARAGITVLGIDISQKFVDILVNNSKQDSSTGDKQSWGLNSCSAGANLNSNFTNIIDKKLDKWNNRFSQRRLKCRKDGTGTKEKKFLKVFDICPSGCRFKNDKVFDKMYIAKFQIFLNNGEKDKFIYFPVHVDIKP